MGLGLLLSWCFRAYSQPTLCFLGAGPVFTIQLASGMFHVVDLDSLPGTWTVTHPIEDQDGVVPSCSTLAES